MSTANLTREEARSRTEAIGLDTYEVCVDVTGAKTPENLTFPVVATVSFTSAAADTWLDFIGDVDSVVLNGVEVEVEYDGARIHLRGLSTTETNRVTVAAQGRYSRSGQGLHRFVDPVDGETYLYTQYEPADSRRVFPCFEQPDLKARHVWSLIGPAEWLLLVNQPEVAREDVGGGNVLVTFSPTPLLSTYITAIAAGPYARWEGEWSRDDLVVATSVMCRKSLAEFCDHENFLAITHQGMDFFHDNFGYPYPWGKYDSILVPEYNLGAMENPGLVTFTENYVFRTKAVRSQYAARANTILHEMSHMWFGDLVTPQWWDDLWLKESFAEYMGAHSSIAATEFDEAWVNFAGGRKQWAYMQDQLCTTHPITADIPNLEAAKQNFDGITYAKGASVLKQLVAYVGVDEFFAGSRAYFHKHAFSATTLNDLLEALEAASGRDLKDWSAKWLQTSGPDTLRPVVEAADGAITTLFIEQKSLDAVTGEKVGRPHRLAVGLYRLTGAEMEKYADLELDVPGEGAEVVEARGLAVPDLVLVNDRDLTYAKIRFDARSLATVTGFLSKLTDPLARTLVWSGLWDMTSDGELPARDYVATVVAHARYESSAATLGTLLANAAAAIEGFAPVAVRPALREQFVDAAWARMADSEPGSDTQLLWTRAFATVAAATASATDRLRSLLDGAGEGFGLDVNVDLRWMVLRALAALGAVGVEELDAELARDNTASGVTARIRALASIPTAQAKADAWEQLMTPGKLPNDHVDAMLVGWHQPTGEQFTAPYAERYFDGLLDVWASHPIEIGLRLVRGLFPGGDAEPGRPIETHPAVLRAQSWLDAHPDAPVGLLRPVREQLDHLHRSLRAQENAS